MKKTIALFLFVLITNTFGFACSCVGSGDGTFGAVANSSSYVVLVKVVSLGDYFAPRSSQPNDTIPGSMHVEIVKKYKGAETRLNLKILGGDGADCREQLYVFEQGKHYLLIPFKLKKNARENEDPEDYYLFDCIINNLSVDVEANQVRGKYSKTLKSISLSDFEKNLKL